MVGARAAQPCPRSHHLQHCQGSSMHGEGAENGSRQTRPFCPRGLSLAKHFLLYHCTESLWAKPLFLLQALLKKMLLSLYLHPASLFCGGSAPSVLRPLPVVLTDTVSAVHCGLFLICIFLFCLSCPQFVSCLQQELSLYVPTTSISKSSHTKNY